LLIIDSQAVKNTCNASVQSKGFCFYKATNGIKRHLAIDTAQIIKYGHTHYGKPRFRCQDCGQQFVLNATRQPIEEATRQLIDKLLLERLALAAIARVTGVSERWLQMYVNQKFYQTSKAIDVTPKKQVG
jgi:hypothetical protein